MAVNTPALSHSRNRLWTELGLPKRSLASDFHWQPVRSTNTTASNTWRAGLGGRPAPSLRITSKNLLVLHRNGGSPALRPSFQQ